MLSLRISVQLKYDIMQYAWGLLGLGGGRSWEIKASPTYTPNISGFRWVHGGTQLCFLFECCSPCIEPSFEIQMTKLWTGGAGPVESDQVLPGQTAGGSGCCQALGSYVSKYL